MADRINRNIDWVTDDFGELVGYADKFGRRSHVPRITYDGAGNATGLVGAGGVDPLANSLKLTADGLTLAGNSLTAVQAAQVRAGIDPLAFRPRTLPEFMRSYSGYGGLRTTLFGNSLVDGVNGANFLEKFVRLSNGLYLEENAGIGGDSSQDMIDRMATDIPASTQICIFTEGPNDAGDGVTPSQHAANYRTIIDHLLGRGILPVMISASPMTLHPALIEAYRAVEFLVAREYGITIWDPWVDYVDPSTGAWLSGASTDNSHPTAATQDGATDKLLSFLGGSATPPTMAPRCNASGTAGFCLLGGNSYFLTDANADGVAEGWTKAGTLTASIVDAPSGYRGKMQKIANAGASGSPYVRRVITSGWAAGDRLLLSVGFEAVSVSPNGQVYIDLKHSGVNKSVLTGISNFNVSARRFYHEFTPTTTDSMELLLKINGAGSGSSIGAFEAEIYNLTALGA